MRECGALLPPLPGADPGWDCTGKDLIVLYRAGKLPPTVLRHDLVEQYGRPYRLELMTPFAGGDHLHAILNPWPHGYGTCPVCGKTKPVQRDSTMARHWHDGGPCTGTCEPAIMPMPYPWDEGEIFRVGRKVGRTVYLCPEPGIPDDGQETLVGMFDTPALAALAVRAMNQLVNEEPELLREVDHATPRQARQEPGPGSQGDSGAS